MMTFFSLRCAPVLPVWKSRSWPREPLTAHRAAVSPAAPSAPARRTQGFSSAARFARRTADSEAATAAKNPRRRLDSGTGPPFLAGDPCKCVAWITAAISWPPHCQRPLFNRPSLPTAGSMMTIPSEWFFEEPDGLRRLTVVPALPWPSLPRRRQGAITLLCNGLGKYDSWTIMMRFRQKTFQGTLQKGNSSSSGPYEPGRSYRPVIIAGHSACPSTTGAEAIFLLAASRWVLFQAEARWQGA